MKNVNVFVDVDLTLVDHNGRLIEGAETALRSLKRRGCHLYLWSNGGAQYARAVAERHKLSDLFEAFVPKPDVLIDDAPAPVSTPFIFDPNDSCWQSVTEKIEGLLD
jgi:phosphoglycolate phosphatase-like HAD superfamily hydrolase